MKDFNGKNAVITGAASGIGYALAEKLAKEGMNIVLADIEQEALETAVEKISEHGVKTLGVKTDVMMKNEVEHLFNESIKAFDKVHFLCNNAGVDQQYYILIRTTRYLLLRPWLLTRRCHGRQG